MKYILTLFLLGLAFNTIAQEHAQIDKVLKEWVGSFNDQKYEAVYNLYGRPYQSKVSLEKQTMMLKDVFGMMGKLKSAKFISYEKFVYKYIIYAQKIKLKLM